tara:strand:+ start:4812 stop:5159 length:348 start_codon:yes stop_codon:yes gene_type:complete
MILNKYALFFILFLSLFHSSEVSNHEDGIRCNKDPEMAWKLSLIPGLGQAYNEKYVKGSLFFLSELSLINNISIYSTDIAMRNSLMWLAIGIYVYNIIDAYVDAELNTFNNKDKE